MEAKDWITLVIGLPTLAFSAFNAWIAFRNRSSSHRDVFYKKQMEEYDKFLFEYNKYDREYFYSVRDIEDKDERIDKLLEFHYCTTRQLKIISLYASDEVISSIIALDTALNSVSKAVEDGGDVDFTEQFRVVNNAFLDLTQTMRQSLGFVRLDSELKKVIGIKY